MAETVVKIEKMAFGGAGFGHLEGKACFVPFTAPGDIARIKILKETRSYLEGELVELLHPSDRRVIPPCHVFGRCGGCNWQHLAYSDQLSAKEDIFAEILWRSGRVERDRIEPIAPAPDPYGYRSRIQLKVRCIDGEPQIGFYRSGSHFVVDIPKKCAIVHPRINRLINGLRQMVALFPEPEKIPQMDVAVGSDGRTELIIHYIGNRRKEIISHFRENRNNPGADAIFLQTGRKATLEMVSGEKSLSLSYSIPDCSSRDHSEIKMTFSSGGFSQINYQQNISLVETVCNWAGLTGKERVLDIYCGNGNFSIPLAGKSSYVLGVEDYEQSISSAKRNCETNGIKNISFQFANAVSIVKQLVSTEETFDLVLLDPPRSGAGEVVKIIPALRPRAILYVSCNPPTLARDIGILKKFDYDVVKSRPVDMFPQTYHIESVTLLEPANKNAHN
jgi:23S rRNA (uracil1939-C5)-methyltransferase